MNWTKWKLGLLVACLTGVFSGLVGLVIGATWRQICILLVVNLAKDGLLFLKQHPVDEVTFDVTQTTTVKQTTTVTPTQPDK